MKKIISQQRDSQFQDVLTQIQTAKQQAFQQVNQALVQLYWEIGRYVSQQVISAQWGKGTVKELAAFIQQKEPSMSGFSARNIWRMKQFFEIYDGDLKLSSLGTVLSWTHHRRIMTLKTPEERAFYDLLDYQESQP